MTVPAKRAGTDLHVPPRTIATIATIAPAALLFLLACLAACREPFAGPVRFLPDDAAETFSRKLARDEFEAAGSPAGGLLLAAAWERPWKLKIRSDLRNALVAPPGRAHRKTVRVPRSGGELSGAYGVDRRSPAATEFTVSIVEPSGEQQTIHQATIGPEKTSVGWRSFRVGLDPFAGQTVEIVLEATRPAEFQWHHGLAAWANVRFDPAAEPNSATPNVLLISLDTVRADRLSLYGHQRPTTPKIDRWVRRGGAVRFDQAIAPAPWTLPSHLSMFTGLDPLRHGINHPEPFGTEFETVAQTLRRAGYATVGLTAGGYVAPHWGFSRGYDVYSSRKSRTAADDELVRGIAELMGWLEQLPEPWFVFFHTYEVHTPYSVREPYFSSFGGRGDWLEKRYLLSHRLRPEDGDLQRDELMLARQPKAKNGRRLTAAERQQVPVLYDSAIAFTDHQLGSVFDYLETSGLEERTAVVLTSDHGESLGEHGLDVHAALYDELLHVPLVVRRPSRSTDSAQPAEPVTTQVRTIDVAPTVLALAGLEPSSTIDGVSLLPLLDEPDTLFPNDAWSYAPLFNRGVSLRRANGQKLIYRNSAWSVVHGETELYNLQLDPLEQEPVSLDDDGGDRRGRELHAMVLDRLAARQSDIALMFRNLSEEVARVQLQSKAIQLNSLTATRLPLPCRAVRGDEADGEACFQPVAGGALVVLPAGAELEIRIDGPVDSPALFELSSPGLGAVLQLSVAPGEDSWIERQASGWVRTVAETSAPVVLRISRLEQLARRSTEDELPAELEQELEALGYIN